jgi:RNA polymerase sigma factor (sigma-70 family)
MSWKELETESTEDLITCIGWNKDPEMLDHAKNAFQAFCFRFQQDVAKKCRIICNNRGYGRDIGDDLAQKVFERFWKYPKFNFKKSSAKTFDDGVKLYLYGFASNLLNDFYNAQHNPNPNPYTGEEELVYEMPDPGAVQIPPEKLKVLQEKAELVRKALDRLGPKHKIIYLTYQQHSQNGFNLPAHLLEKLRTALGLTQVTIRSYKKEAFDKIKEYLDIYGSK